MTDRHPRRLLAGRKASLNAGLAEAWAAVDALSPLGLSVHVQRNPRGGYRARTWVTSALPTATYRRRKLLCRTSETWATPLEALRELEALLLEARMDAAA